MNMNWFGNHSSQASTEHPVSVGRIVECAADLAAAHADPAQEALPKAAAHAATGNTRDAQLYTSAAFLLARGRA